MTEQIDPSRIPVIVGQGETLDRPVSLDEAREPLTLMADAARHAESDAGVAMLAAVDSLDVVSLASWRYRDIAGSVAQAIGASPARLFHGEVGGESPVRMLHEAALRIARGESQVALVCGAEAQHSAAKARRSGVELPWTPFCKDGPKIPSGQDIVHPLAAAAGLSQPVTVYPLYDMASATAWGQTPAEALAESGEIWARYSAVAATNPTSWLSTPLDAEAIVTPRADNRPIAFPYTKLMVANPMVNQGAAILMTSLARARELGIPDERMIHVHGGAAASEPRDFMARDQFTQSHAQNAVLAAAEALSPDGFAAIELYSCFPCVPKMARRTLGLGADVQPTVTGGLTFFGAPLSVYMLHAACAMVRRLRRGGTGLLYGQGEFVTKHHALVVSANAAPGLPEQDYSVQAIADAARGVVPPTVEPTPGLGTVESATVIYGRDGEVLNGAVVLRVGSARTVATVPPEDVATLAVLTGSSASPVGRSGTIEADAEGRMRWRAE